MNPYTPYATPAATTMRKIDAPGTSRNVNAANSAKYTGSKVMPHSTPETAIPEAYAMALKGRRQAALAANQLEGQFHRISESRAAFRAVAVSWLAGIDLASGGVQASSQAVIKRLNEALSGDGLMVTKALLDDEAINRLRIFRQQVRELMT